MKIWKISFSRESSKKDTTDNLHYCLSHGIVAVTRDTGTDAWDGAPDWEDMSLFEQYKDYPSELYALFSQIRGYDLIWTRDPLGVYFLGRVLETESYRFKKGGKVPGFLSYPCKWFRIGTIDSISQVIVDAFSPYRRLRLIGDSDANLYTRLVYNEQVDDFSYPIPEIADGNLFDLFSEDDYLDIVALYLQQNHGYRIIPSSFDRETGLFDFTVSIGMNGSSGAVKVTMDEKPLNIEEYATFHGPVYIFAPNSTVLGIVPQNIHIISTGELQGYMIRNILSLPYRLSNWVRYYLQTVGFGGLE